MRPAPNVAWNLFLAVIPVALAFAIARGARRDMREAGRIRWGLWLPLGVVWLAFLPNSCYLLTEWRQLLRDADPEPALHAVAAEPGGAGGLLRRHRLLPPLQRRGPARLLPGRLAARPPDPTPPGLGRGRAAPSDLPALRPGRLSGTDLGPVQLLGSGPPRPPGGGAGDDRRHPRPSGAPGLPPRLRGGPLAFLCRLRCLDGRPGLASGTPRPHETERTQRTSCTRRARTAPRGGRAREGLTPCSCMNPPSTAASSAA